MSSLTMATGAKLDVRVDATSGNVDKANVTGTATLNGGVLNVAATPNDKTQWASPISTKQKYTVLSAGTLTFIACMTNRAAKSSFNLTLYYPN